MKLVTVFSAILALAVAAPQQNSKDATIVKYESDNIGIDGYNFNSVNKMMIRKPFITAKCTGFKTSDGVSRSETGELKNAGSENKILVVRGTISWTGADGVSYKIEFVADENGFQPKGAHLPK